jgi:hypothetical protein
VREAAHVMDGGLMGADGFDACLIIIDEDALAGSTALVARIAPSLTADAAVTVLVTRPPADEISLFAPGETPWQDGWSVTHGYINAGPVRRAVQQRLTRLMRAAYGAPMALLPFYAIGWVGLAAASYLCNLAAMRPAAKPQGLCSSAVLLLQRAWPAAYIAGTPACRPSTRLMVLCTIS